MPAYSAGVATPAPLTVAPYATIRAGTATRIRLLEVGVFCNAATLSSIGLYRAANTFVPTTSALGQAYDTSDQAALGNIDTAWSTAPTVATVPLRRAVLPAAIGAGIVWQFDDLVVGPAGTAGLVVWNFGGATASVLQLFAVWRE